MVTGSVLTFSVVCALIDLENTHTRAEQGKFPSGGAGVLSLSCSLSAHPVKSLICFICFMGVGGWRLFSLQF